MELILRNKFKKYAKQNKFLLFIISMLGFSTVNENSSAQTPEYGVVPLYGTVQIRKFKIEEPALLTIRGSVLTKESKPLGEVKVIVTNYGKILDSTKTNEKGDYILNFNEVPKARGLYVLSIIYHNQVKGVKQDSTFTNEDFDNNLNELNVNYYLDDWQK